MMEALVVAADDDHVAEIEALHGMCVKIRFRVIVRRGKGAEA